jgi:hypothetical protein
LLKGQTSNNSRGTNSVANKISLQCSVDTKRVFFGYIPEKNYFRDFFKFPQFFTYSLLTSTTESNTRREIVLEATPEAKTVYSCTLQLPARVSPPSSVFSVSSALKSQSNFLLMKPRENDAHHPRSETVGKKTQQPSRDWHCPTKEVCVLPPAYLQDFREVISRFRVQ